MSRFAVLAIIAGACTDPSPQPLSGTFAFTGRFDGHVLKTFQAGPAGVVERYDSTQVNGPVLGAVTFDSLVESIASVPAVLTLNQCGYCRVGSGVIGHAFRVGDSVKVMAGVSPNLQLLGVYRGDSIVGRIQDTSPFSGPNGSGVSTYWGAFVAMRVQPDPPVTFVLRGFFDSLTTSNGQGVMTGMAAADSIRGSLVIEALNIGPLGSLAVEKCGQSCFGQAAAVPPAYGGYTGAGRRAGDSVVFNLVWDLMSRLEVRGVYRGDSIVGAITSSRQTSTATIYSGRFVARRSP